MGSSAAAAAAAAAAADSAQWLSVKEETIFLHDGLIRVTDLAELPSEILGAPEAADTDLEVSDAAPRPPPSDWLTRQHPGVGPSHLRLTPTWSPRPPKAIPAGVVGARRAVGGRAAGLQIARLPASSGPHTPRDFVLNVPTHGILLDYGRARPPRPVQEPPSPPRLSPLPRGPSRTPFQGTPRMLSFGDILILCCTPPPFLSPALC